MCAVQWLEGGLGLKIFQSQLNNFFRFEGHTNSIMHVHNNYRNF
jgi:hypothetical protein